jgi:hypothetical protein
MQLSRGIRASSNPYRAIAAAGFDRPTSQPRKYELKFGVCRHHGYTEFRSDKDYRKNKTPRITFRCLLCFKLKKKKHRLRNSKSTARNKKYKLVQMAGGSCKLCGYDKCLSAMHFHHRDRLMKNFEIAYGLRRFTLEKLSEEISKCVLLCNRCHAELEEGLVKL